MNAAAKKSLKRLVDWLREDDVRSENIVIPVDPDTKKPLFAHKDGSWTWDKFDEALKSGKYTAWGILARNIVVIDFDQEEDFAKFEEEYPDDFGGVNPLAKTKKGYHVYFSRPADFDTVKLWDKAGAFKGYPKIDCKTVASTGTAGLINVSPSPGKTWIREPWAEGCELIEPSAELQKWMIENYLFPKGGHSSIDRSIEEDLQKHILRKLEEFGFILPTIINETEKGYSYGIWEMDETGKRIYLCLSCRVCPAYLQRAVQFAQRALRDEENRASLEERSQVLLGIAKKLKQTNYRTSLLSDLTVLMNDKTFFERLDTVTNVIGFTNGVFDLNSMTFRRGLPEDMISKTVGYDYCPEVDSVKVAKILSIYSDIIEEEIERNFVMGSIAFSLSGRTDIQKLDQRDYRW